MQSPFLIAKVLDHSYPRRERPAPKEEKLRNRRPGKASALAVWAIAILAPTAVLAASAAAKSMPLYGDQPVSVNVGFSTFLPLPDLSDQTLASAQTTGRSVIYRLARDECAVLKSTIARTCRLTSISVSTRIDEHDNGRPLKLYLNGNAQFAITLENGEGD